MHPVAAPVLESNSTPHSSMSPHKYTSLHGNVMWLLTEAQQFPATICRCADSCGSTTIYCGVVWLVAGEQLLVPIKMPQSRLLAVARHSSSQWRNYMLKQSTPPHRGTAAHFYNKHNICSGILVFVLLFSELNKLPWLGEVSYSTNF